MPDPHAIWDPSRAARPRAGFDIDRLLWGGVVIGVAYSTAVDRFSLLAPVVALGLVAAVVLTARWLNRPLNTGGGRGG